jgi:hypothetical protein
MMHRRLALLLGAVSLLVGACASRPETAAGPSAPGGGGIGGTGVIAGWADAGVFGTVTGVGSIDVNGLRIVIPAALRPESLPDLLPAGRVAVGETVAVAAGREDGETVARRLVKVRPLVGPVSYVAPDRRGLAVMRTPVLLDESAPTLAELAADDWVAVSGLWRDGAVIASRVDRVPPQATASISGLLRGAGSARAVGATEVDLSCCAPGAPAGFVAVAGRYRGGRLVAERVAGGAAALFPPGVDRLVVEAFLARNPDDDGYHLSGFGIPMDPASSVPPVVGRRSVFVGRYDGNFLIEGSYPAPRAGGPSTR